MTRFWLRSIAVAGALGLSGFSNLVHLRPTEEADKSKFSGEFYNNKLSMSFGTGNNFHVLDLTALRDTGHETMSCSQGRSAVMELAPGSELPSPYLVFGSNGRGNGRVRYEGRWYRFEWP